MRASSTDLMLMPKDKDNPDKPESAERPSLHHGSTQVTIAFPFSQIRSQQPSAEMRELAAILGELAVQLAEFRPSPATRALAQRAQALAVKLAT
jgi:hypothetical protein